MSTSSRAPRRRRTPTSLRLLGEGSDADPADGRGGHLDTGVDRARAEASDTEEDG